METVSAQQQFCDLFLQLVAIRKQAFSSQYPSLRNSEKWLRARMHKKKYLSVCKSVYDSMRPIIQRLKMDGGDETLIAYARDNRVELFEHICFAQTYANLTPEEQTNMWLMLKELARLIGFSQLAADSTFGALTAKACEIARHGSKEGTPQQTFSDIFSQLTDNPELRGDLQTTMKSLLQKDHAQTTGAVLNLLENVGLITNDQRSKAEQDMETKKANEQQDETTGETVKMHVSSCVPDSINDIAQQMLEKDENRPTSVEEMMAKMSTSSEQFMSMKENLKNQPPKDLSTLLLGLATNIPKSEKKQEDVNQILELLTSTREQDQHIKEKMKRAANDMVNGNTQGLLGHAMSIISDFKSNGTEQQIPDFSEADFHTASSLMQNLMPLNASIPKATFDA